MKTNCFITLLAALACPLIAAVTSPVVGVMHTTLKGDGHFNLISSPFLLPVKVTCSVTAANGTAITVDAADLSSVAAGSDYVEVVSTTRNGVTATILSINGTTLTLAQNLGLQVGDELTIRAVPTIGTLFGPDNRYSLQPSASGDPSEADQILIIDSSSQATSTYFYSTYPGFEGWFDTTSFEPASSVLLHPERGLIVQVNGADVDMFLYGEVKMNQTVADVFTGFNVLGVLDPLTTGDSARLLTLGNGGFYTGSDATGVHPSASGDPDEADWIYVIDPDTQSATTYFYSTYPGFEGWFDTTSFEPADDQVLRGGTSFYLLRRSGTAFAWTQPANHITAE